MKKNYPLLIMILAAGLVSAQNVGIGTNVPQTKLQVEGAISTTPSSAAAAAAVTITDNTSVFRLTATAGVQANALSMTTPHEGQYLTIYNADDDAATFAGQTISPTNGVANFNYINGGWRMVSNTKAGGDLSGSYPNPAVVKIQGKSVAATAPANGDVLKYNTSTSQYEPSPDLNSGGTVGTVTASSPLSSSGGSSPNISLTGTVPVANGGTGLTAIGAGQILIGTSSNTFLNTTLTGTANQVNINSASGAITFSTPQDIATTSNVTFNKASLNTATDVNSLEAGRSIKIGSTAQTASAATAGALQYSGGFVQYSDGSNWKTLSITTGTVSAVTASNGLTSSGGTTPDITLGGTLTGATTIANAGYNLNLTGTGNVGIGTAATSQKLAVGGAIELGNTATPTVGTIRWNSTTNDFEGYDGQVWMSITGLINRSNNYMDDGF